MGLIDGARIQYIFITGFRGTLSNQCLMDICEKCLLLVLMTVIQFPQVFWRLLRGRGFIAALSQKMSNNALGGEGCLTLTSSMKITKLFR